MFLLYCNMKRVAHFIRDYNDLFWYHTAVCRDGIWGQQRGQHE